MLLGIVFCAAYFGPEGPHGIPDPTQINTAPKPDFFFLWIYGVLSLMPDYMETVVMLTAPFIVIAILFAVPFISNTGEKSPRRRPVAVLSVLLILIVLGAFNYLGTYAPWSPKMEAWTSAATPTNYLEGRSPLERQGALVFHNKQCINCHSVAAYGKNLSPPEVAALVAFMNTLHKPTEAPARDATRPAQAAAGDTQTNATAQMASTKP